MKIELTETMAQMLNLVENTPEYYSEGNSVDSEDWPEEIKAQLENTEEQP